MRRGNKYKTKESYRKKIIKRKKRNKIKRRKKCGQMKVEERTEKDKG